MDMAKQLIKVGSLIQSVNHFEDYLPLGFHSLQIGYFQQAYDNSVFTLTRVAAGFRVKPSPARILMPEPAAHVDLGFQRRPQAAQDGAKQVQIVLMDQLCDRSAGDHCGRMAEHFVKGGIRKKNSSFGIEDSDKLTDAFEQLGQRARGVGDVEIRRGWMRHGCPFTGYYSRRNIFVVSQAELRITITS